MSWRTSCIYDPSDFTPEAGDFITYAVPFNEIARKEVQLFQTKNMVMLGAIAALFGPPLEAIVQVVESKLSRSRKSNPILMEKNMLALDIAQKYVAEQLPKAGSIPTRDRGEEQTASCSMCQAVVAGALAAHCRFLCGLSDYSSKRYYGSTGKRTTTGWWHFLQAEDEIAALAAVLGASFGGVRAMTATSGPAAFLLTDN